MITPKGFLNCYELDEWYQQMEDRAFDDDDDDSDNNDDDYLKATYYPEEL